MKCKWCANPESQSFLPEILVNTNSCVNCGNCIRNCPNNAIHKLEDRVYITDQSSCSRCMQCIKSCYVGARSVAGKTYTSQELLHEVMKDQAYYLQSGGGVTFSGGEPLCHASFIAECANALHAKGINILIETCGLVSLENLKLGAACADYMFYDLKHMESESHQMYTGQPNDHIIDNLKWLNSHYKGFLSVRCPIIPSYNDDPENIKATLDFIATLDHVSEVWFLPYHRLGLPKYKGLGRPYELENMKSLKFKDIEYLKSYQEHYKFPIKI